MGWKEVRVGDVCTVVAGQSPKGSAYNDVGLGLPFYQGKKEFGDRLLGAPTTWTSVVTKEAQPGDILMSVRAPVGPINEATQRVCIGRGLAAIRAGHRLNRDFLWYALLWLQPAIRGSAGAVFDSINKRGIEQLPIYLPPLEEQQRIVAVLDEAFDGLARARANAEANFEDAWELFESFRSTVLTDQSEGWERRRLAECFRLKSGDNLTAKEMVAGKYPVYGGNGVAGTHNQCNLSGDNVIVGRVGALCGNARFIDHEAWLTDNAFKVVDYGLQFDPKFLTYLLNFKNLRSLARQTAQPVISNSSLAELELSFPRSVEAQAELASKLAEVEVEIELLRKQYERKVGDLNDLRRSLLDRAFAGELT